MDGKEDPAGVRCRDGHRASSFAVGCASTKTTAQLSGEKIFRADKAFSDAKDGNASLNAKDALAVAEGKLAKAKDAFGQNFDEATNLAEQAVVDADYAHAKATTQKSLKIAEEIRKQRRPAPGNPADVRMTFLQGGIGR